MKKFKKIMAVLVAAVLMVAMMVPAWAAGESVVLHNNGATQTIAGSTIDFASIDNPTPPTGSQIAFIGWTETEYSTLQANATPPTYFGKNGTGSYASIITVTKPNKDLYALWGYDYNGNQTADAKDSGNLVTISYDANGGKGAPDSFTTKYDAGGEITISNEVPTPPESTPEYIFAGWTAYSTPALLTYTNKDLAGTYNLLSASAKVDVPSSDTTYKAVWAEDTNGDKIADYLQTKVTISYNMNKDALDVKGIIRTVETNKTKSAEEFFSGAHYKLTGPGDGSANDKKGIAWDEVHSNPEPVAFIGWSETKTNKCYASGESIAAIIDDYTPTANKTLYAVWGLDRDSDGIADAVEDVTKNNKDTILISAHNTDVDSVANPETHYAYKIFDVTKANTFTTDQTNIGETVTNADTGFAYTISEDNEWYSFISGDSDVENYVTLAATSAVNENNSPIWNVVWNPTKNTETDAKAFADILKNNTSVFGNDSSTQRRRFKTGETLYSQPGYYLISSSLGTNLILATSNINVNDKNNYISTDKVDLKNSVTIGKKTTYFINVFVPESVDTTKTITVHDTLDSQLKFEASTLQYIITDNSSYDYASYPTNGTSVTSSSNVCTLNSSPDDDCTFEITIDLSASNEFGVGNKYVIFRYDAELLSDAAPYGDGYKNKEYCEYSNYKTPTKDVTVKTYEFDVKKIDTNNNPLNGAVFELHRDSANGEIVEFIRNKYYKDATYTVERAATDLGAAIDGNVYSGATGIAKVACSKDSDKTKNIVVNDTLNVEGLGEGIYYLVEIVAPQGYNRLTAPIRIEISDGGNQKYGTDADDDSLGTGDDTTHTFTVTNTTSALIPSTGGMGTTVLYIVGGMLVILAGAYLFFSRKKTA